MIGGKYGDAEKITKHCEMCGREITFVYVWTEAEDGYGFEAPLRGWRDEWRLKEIKGGNYLDVLETLLCDECLSKRREELRVEKLLCHIKDLLESDIDIKSVKAFFTKYGKIGGAA